MNKQINILGLIALLEMPESCLNFLKVDYQTAISGLDEFKGVVKKQRRLLAIQYHPDKEYGSNERMKEINAAVDLLLMLRIERPRPQPRVIVFQFGGFASTTSATSTATATTMF